MTNEENNQFDRILFLEKVVKLFSACKTSEKALDATLSGCLFLVGNDSKDSQQIIEEKSEILRRACSEFKKDNLKLQYLITEVKKQYKKKYKQDASYQTVSRVIAKKISEAVLGDGKRKYDMSKLCSENQITPNSPSLISVDRMSVELPSGPETTIKIKQVGTLKYKTLSSTESVDQFQIVQTSEDGSEYEATIFSHIDLNRLNPVRNPEDFDHEYCDAVLGELLSRNNLELSQAGGYVGEIKETQRSPFQLKPGAQRVTEEKFYRYQISEKHALVFDPQDLSAVVSYSKKKALEEQQANKDEQATPKTGLTPSDASDEPAL